MVLVELSPATISPQQLTAFKAHLRMGSGFADDAIQDEVLDSYLRAAMAAIEARIGKKLLHRVIALTLNSWSCDLRQPLPLAPVTSLSSLILTDSAGNDEVIDATRYRLEQDVHRPSLMPVGYALPSIPDGGTATLVFETGFGPEWADVPSDLAQAVFLLAAHYYDHRADTSGVSGLMPFGVMSLVEPHRNIRIFGGSA